MIARNLKKAIIQAAIKGNIIYQDENDEKIIDTLSSTGLKIIDQRNKLDFDIPDSWIAVKFGEVFRIVSSRRIHKSDWRSQGIPFYRAREIAKLADNGYVDNELFIDETLFEDLKDDPRMPEPGDIMVTGVGTLGKSYIVSDLDSFYYKDASVLCVKNVNRINSQYFKIFMESQFMKDQIDSNSSGTTVATLTINRFNEYLFILPPLQEQKRIVEKLDELLTLIDSLEKDELKLKDLMQQFPNSMTSSILLQAMEGKLVDQYPEDGKAINELKQILKIDNTVSLENELDYSFPENWELIELEKVCDLSTGNSINETVKKTKYSKKINGYSYIGTKDVNFDHTIDYNNGVYIPYDDSFRVAKSGSTLLCIEGGSAGRKIGLLDRDVCYGNKLVSIFPLYINPKFVFYFVKSPIFQSQFKENMTGMIGGVGINKIKKIYIPIPPLSIQKRIVEKLDQILPIVEKIHYEKY